MTRPYPDPSNPGILTNGAPMPGYVPTYADPEWYRCEVCGRSQQFSEGYIEHLTSRHRMGVLARRINPQLFGDPKPLPSLAELGENVPVEGTTT